jgi:hypothetical protein
VVEVGHLIALYECLECHGRDVKSRGIHKSLYMGVPARDRRVGLLVHRQPFRCR